MCGIGGTFQAAGLSRGSELAQQLLSSLRHRGPDGNDYWQDSNVLLVHTRLAIIDLTETGAQPMRSQCGRYVITFNGEIYNYVELAEELRRDGVVLRGTSDTEVLLESYVLRGERILSELDGMFAFAIYDTRDKTLFLARDPLGEKPLYFTNAGGSFSFASEVRALEAAGLTSREPDLAALGVFLRQGSLPPPFTHLKDVKQLAPGHLIRVTRAGSSNIERYYSLPFKSESDCIQNFDEAVDSVVEALKLSVRRRVRADVSVAAFLSGGIDSALVCALLAEQSADVTAFTVTMPGKAGDESVRAGEIARAVGLKHLTVPLEYDRNGEWLCQALDALDLPSIDGTNTWLVSRAVAEAGFKVACSGVGGDELFFGYPSFESVTKAARVTGTLKGLSLWRKSCRTLARRLPKLPLYSRAIDALLAGGSLAAVWFAKRGLFSEGEVAELLTEAVFAKCTTVDPFERVESLSCPDNVAPGRQVSNLELQVYLHDQLLRDTDVMSMAHSLEVRLPLLGLPVISAALGISSKVLSRKPPKAVLVEILRRVAPLARFDAPKQGFTLAWSDLLPLTSPAPNPPWLAPGSSQRESKRFEHGRASYSRSWSLEVAARKFPSLAAPGAHHGRKEIA